MDGVALFEFKAEIPLRDAGVVDELLLEQGLSSWHVTEDVIAGTVSPQGLEREAIRAPA